VLKKEKSWTELGERTTSRSLPVLPVTMCTATGMSCSLARFWFSHVIGIIGSRLNADMLCLWQQMARLSSQEFSPAIRNSALCTMYSSPLNCPPVGTSSLYSSKLIYLSTTWVRTDGFKKDGGPEFLWSGLSFSCFKVPLKAIFKLFFVLKVCTGAPKAQNTGPIHS